MNSKFSKLLCLLYEVKNQHIRFTDSNILSYTKYLINIDPYKFLNYFSCLFCHHCEIEKDKSNKICRFYCNVHKRYINSNKRSMCENFHNDTCSYRGIPPLDHIFSRKIILDIGIII